MMSAEQYPLDSCDAVGAMEDEVVMSDRNRSSSLLWSCWNYLSACCRQPSTVLSLCTTVCVGILSAVVIFIVVQLQVLTVRVSQDEQEIADLRQELSYRTQDQIEELNNKVDQQHSLTLDQAAGTFTLLTTLLSIFHMYSHLSNYHEPSVQRKIVAILWLSPIYGLTAFCSLVVPSANPYLSVIRDFYEAYTVFTFLSFLIAVLGRGDRETAVQVLAEQFTKHDADDGENHHLKPMRCLNSCYHPPPDTSDLAMANAVLTECQILTIQFVFVRPITSIANFVADLLMMDEDENENSSSVAFFTSPSFFIGMVTNVSVFLAFTGLLKFYHAVREDLKWMQPFNKFMTIKGIVFLTFWQGLLITIAVSLQASNSDKESSENGFSSSSSSTPQEEAAQIQNFLICLEMLFFSIAHWCVFPAEEWQPDYRPKLYGTSMPGLGLKDFVSDVNQIIVTSSEARAYRRQTQQQEEQGGYEEDDVDAVLEAGGRLERPQQHGQYGTTSYLLHRPNGQVPTASDSDEDDNDDDNDDNDLIIVSSGDLRNENPVENTGNQLQ